MIIALVKEIVSTYTKTNKAYTLDFTHIGDHFLKHILWEGNYLNNVTIFFLQERVVNEVNYYTNREEISNYICKYKEFSLRL